MLQMKTRIKVHRRFKGIYYTHRKWGEGSIGDRKYSCSNTSPYMGLSQLDSLGEYYGPHTASSVFLILVCMLDVRCSRGGGHWLFEGNYPLPNYRPRFSGPSTPEFSLTAPYFWEFETTAL